nr:Chain B, Amyloid beta A4 protein [synthetic construct]
TYKFFEQ